MNSNLGNTMHPTSKTMDRFAACRMLVVGDLMLDEYLWGDVQRISPEAPVPILRLHRRESTLGGAGNVVRNLRSLGAQVSAVGVIGNDPAGEEILQILDSLNVTHAGVIKDPDRSSTSKTRLMAVEHGQQVFRMDRESTKPVGGDVEQFLVAQLKREISQVDAILCSDYLKGVLTPAVLQAAFEGGRSAKVPVVVGPKDSAPAKYRGADVLIPNLKEFLQLSKSTPAEPGWMGKAASTFMSSFDISALLVTRGPEGMSLFEKSGTSFQSVDLPTVARTVYDVTGAGDTVVSVFTLAMAAGADRETSARLANIAGGIVVGKRGTASVTIEELRERLHEEPGAWGAQTASRIAAE